MKSLYQHLDLDSNCGAFNISPALYHRTTVDPRVLTPDVLDDQQIYYQSRGGTLISSTMLFHSANQHYSNSSTTLFRGSPITLHPSSTFSQCVGTTVPMDKLVDDLQDPCLVSRFESGKSPPMRYIHDEAEGSPGRELDLGSQHSTQNSHYGENHEESISEKITIKQESLHYAYLEDGK